MIYKDVVGYEGLYLVSEFGDVIRMEKVVVSKVCSKGFRTLSRKTLKPQNNKDGYLYLLLTDNNKVRKHYFIHQLVAKAFLDNKNDHKIVNHKDEDKKNNHYSNLEWCTVRYNNLYNGRQDKVNIKLRESVSTKKPVIQLTKAGEFVAEFISINDACRRLGMSKEGISKCCNNKRDYYRGFSWKFKR